MNNDNNNINKHQEIVVVVALIAAASLLSLGAVAATTITPAFAGGDDDDGDSVKQKAKAKNNCRVNEAEDNERAFVTQDQTGGGPTTCVGVSANINDFQLILPGPGIGVVDGKLVQY